MAKAGLVMIRPGLCRTQERVALVISLDPSSLIDPSSLPDWAVFTMIVMGIAIPGAALLTNFLNNKHGNSNTAQANLDSAENALFKQYFEWNRYLNQLNTDMRTQLASITGIVDKIQADNAEYRLWIMSAHEWMNKVYDVTSHSTPPPDLPKSIKDSLSGQPAVT